MLTKGNVLYNKPIIDGNYTVAIESHPKDSRYQVISPETNQTIPSIMCHDAAHGGLLMTYKKSSHAKSKDDGQGWEETEVNDTLNVFDSGESRTPTIVLENHPADSRVKISKDGIVQTLSSRMGTGGGNTPMVLENREPVLLESTHSHATTNENGIATTLVKSMEQGKGYVPMVTQDINGDTAGTLDSNYFKGCGEREGTEREVVAVGEVAACLNAQDGRGGVHSQKMSDPEGNFVLESEPKCFGNGQTAQLGLHDIAHTLDCMHEKEGLLEQKFDNLVVRRLTPKECSRLQGYPDGWMDIGEWTDSKGKLHKDSDAPKYKAAGNSIALPFWQWLMDRIAKQLKKDGIENPTMASLFDGISGFPLCATRSGIKPVWSSEIEEFPMAVAERHFGENGDLEKFL